MTVQFGSVKKKRWLNGSEPLTHIKATTKSGGKENFCVGNAEERGHSTMTGPDYNDFFIQSFSSYNC